MNKKKSIKNPEIIKKSENYAEIKINDAIIIKIDFEEFKKTGMLKTDYDETLITAKEAEEQTMSYVNDMINQYKNFKNDKDDI